MDPDPRRWWHGALDVERLAWESVTAARDAAQALATARGQQSVIGTEPTLVVASFAAVDHLRVDGRRPEPWAPMSGFVRAADGWVRVHANYPHHARALERALGARTREELAARVTTMRAQDIEDAVAAARGIAVRVRTPEQWAAHPHARATGQDPWVAVVPAGTRPTLRGGDFPLEGVRVLDLTRVIAGPTCSQLLACLGADVLRLDPPDRPELLDQFLSTGMGKRSAVADLGASRDVVEQLVADADVVLLGYRPGSLDRFGLAPDALAERFGHLVIGSLSAWGEHGPWGGRPGFDSIVQAAVGIATTCGDGEHPGRDERSRANVRPGALPVQALDHATGHLLAAHVMTMLARATAGIVRISLLGAARTLASLPAPPEESPARLPVRTVQVSSPHGTLEAVPPALMVDGRTIERAVGGYGRADLAW